MSSPPRAVNFEIAKFFDENLLLQASTSRTVTSHVPAPKSYTSMFVDLDLSFSKKGCVVLFLVQSYTKLKNAALGSSIKQH